MDVEYNFEERANIFVKEMLLSSKSLRDLFEHIALPTEEATFKFGDDLNTSVLANTFNKIIENEKISEKEKKQYLITLKSAIDIALKKLIIEGSEMDLIKYAYSFLEKIDEYFLFKEPSKKKFGRTVNRDVSHFTAPQISILIQLLYKNNIFIGEKTNFLSCCETLTGLQKTSLNNELWKALSYGKEKSNIKNCEEVLTFINSMKADLELYIRQINKSL